MLFICLSECTSKSGLKAIQRLKTNEFLLGDFFLLMKAKLWQLLMRNRRNSMLETERTWYICFQPLNCHCQKTEEFHGAAHNAYNNN